MPADIQIFDRNLAKIHRDNSSRNTDNHDFLIKEVAQRIAEKFTDGEINREFPAMLELGCRNGYLSGLMQGKAGIEQITLSDISENYINNIPNTEHRTPNSVTCDEEYLPFSPESFDLILSNLSLHWVNDLPGCLIQIRNTLRKGGLFVATMFGGNTLHELRYALQEAESTLTGGVSPRISPFVEVKDAGALLQRAGFSLPVADTDKITVMYKDAFALMHDLRGMGETNALVKRNKSIPPRELFTKTNEQYHKTFANDEGLIPATFEVITMTGWRD